MILLLQQMRAGNEKSFADLSARFIGNRSSHKVEEFISRCSIFKDINKISDENAIRGLPLLLEDFAATWWFGIKAGARTWIQACELIRKSFAPSKPAWRIFIDIFAHSQSDNEPNVAFIPKKRQLLRQAKCNLICCTDS